MRRNRLNRMRTYLVGAMEFAPDGGVQWRERITPWLNSRGVSVFNPCDKPCDVGSEKPEDRLLRQAMLARGQYDEFLDDAGPLRPYDLRMVDISDFLIVHIDTDLHACGTYEEITTANRQKKPIIIHCKQGKKGLPPWLFLMLGKSHVTVFDSWTEVENYLDHINSDDDIDHLKRWVFFGLDKVDKPAEEAFRKRQFKLDFKERVNPVYVGAEADIGDKIVYSNINAGYENDQDDAAEYLIANAEYTISSVLVEKWSTRVYLDEVPGVDFNSVMFSPALVEEE